MEEWILGHELPIRLSFFLGIFGLMALWEIASPRRALSLAKGRRWRANLGIVVFNSVMLRFVFPTAAVGMALFVEQSGWGLFHHYELPFALVVLLAVLLLDFAIYLQHVMFHAVPVLWRLHRMHHADRDYDRVAVSTISPGTRLDAPEPPLLLDVRDDEEFRDAHIGGARHLPLSQLQQRFEELADWRERPIAVICKTDRRSAQAVRMLDAEGFAEPILVKGGMVGWEQAGFPVEGAAQPVAQSSN
ncbi:rhodanese-like domain-containing protein [Thiohalomonas denitrificans]|uniref:Rhodanese-related sulfurtransferase n=1 Tax=Thiohalomonas denitrificans TaxID=415747 RepID=A0A1G5Q949_9GAMM|nr:rhodanese-like domain-containing protein [Thiohalomonas denitrificans]SCZ58373.1 Rhodanese-related sulfurtransferase [Thiohalomonas denitrificans]